MAKGTYGLLSRMGQKYKAKIGTWLDGGVSFLRLGQEWKEGVKNFLYYRY